MNAPTKLTPFAVVYALAALAILVVAAVHRGVWLDEFWSFWVSDGTVPFDTMLKTRWLVDVHPPLYPAFTYAASKLVPLGIVGGRLLNLVPLVLAAAALIHIYASDRRLRRFVFLFALAVASSYYVAWYFAEFRSYFTGLCAFSVIAVCLRRFCEDLRAPGEPAGTGLWLIFGAAIFVCLDIHYVTALFTGIVVATFGFYFLARRRLDYFIRFTVIGIVASLLVLAFVAAQLSFLQKTSGSYWLEASTLDAAVNIGKAMVRPAISQLVLCVAAAVLILRAWRQDKLSRLNDTGVLTFSLLLVTAVAVFLPIIVAIDMKVPLILERYIIPLAIACLAILANFGELADFGERRWRQAFLANCILLTLLFGYRAATQERWSASAHMVLRHLAECPTSRVIARAWHPPGFQNEELVMKSAYAYTARVFGIPAQDLFAQGPGADSTCPDIVWIEHLEIRKFASSDPADVANEFRTKNPDYAGDDITVEFDAQKVGLVLLARKRAAGR